MFKKVFWVVGLMILIEGGVRLGLAADFKYGGVGARPLGMGWAFVGLADDANCIYYNPAGLTQLKAREETFMYAQKMEIINYNYIAVAQPKLGFAYISQSTGDEKTLSKNYKDKELGMSESIYSIAYAEKIIKTIPELSCGAAIKFLDLSTSASGEGGTSFGFDLGLLYKAPVGIKETPPLHLMFQDLTFGLVFKDLGTKMRDEEIKDTFILGTSFKFVRDTRFLFDVGLREDYESTRVDSSAWWYGLGIENKSIPSITIRLGLADGNNFTCGIGLTQKIWSLDYAYSTTTMVDTETNHAISLGLKF